MLLYFIIVTITITITINIIIDIMTVIILFCYYYSYFYCYYYYHSIIIFIIIIVVIKNHSALYSQPKTMASSASVIRSRKGDPLDFAVLLTSLLRGAGYDAYVVNKYAFEIIKEQQH